MNVLSQYGKITSLKLFWNEQMWLEDLALLSLSSLLFAEHAGILFCQDSHICIFQDPFNILTVSHWISSSRKNSYLHVRFTKLIGMHGKFMPEACDSSATFGTCFLKKPSGGGHTGPEEGRFAHFWHLDLVVKSRSVQQQWLIQPWDL